MDKLLTCIGLVVVSCKAILDKENELLMPVKLSSLVNSDRELRCVTQVIGGHCGLSEREGQNNFGRSNYKSQN